MLRGVLPAQHPGLLVVGGGHSEPVLPVIGCTGLVARPGRRERTLACVGDVDVQLLTLCARHAEVEPPAFPCPCDHGPQSNSASSQHRGRLVAKSKDCWTMEDVTHMKWAVSSLSQYGSLQSHRL